MNTMLCTYIRTPSGRRVLCQVTKPFILDQKTFLPMMEVRAIEGARLNPPNRIVVPMRSSMFMKEVTK